MVDSLFALLTRALKLLLQIILDLVYSVIDLRLINKLLLGLFQLKVFLHLLSRVQMVLSQPDDLGLQGSHKV